MGQESTQGSSMYLYAWYLQSNCFLQPELLQEEIHHILETGTFSKTAADIGKKIDYALSKATISNP